VGALALWVLTVTNDGPDGDPDPIVLTSTLPAGTTFLTASGGGTSCAAVAQVVTCTRTAPLYSGDSFALTVVLVPSTAAQPGVLLSASVSTTSVELDASDDSASSLLTVLASVGLSVAQTASLDADERTARFRIGVTSSGPSDTVEPVVLRETLGAGLALTSAAGDGWDCVPATASVTCTRTNPLAPGETAMLDVVARVSASPGAVLRATATLVSGTTYDDEPADDTALAVLSLAGPTPASSAPGDELAPSGATRATVPLALVAVLLLATGAALIALPTRPRRRH